MDVAIFEDLTALADATRSRTPRMAAASAMAKADEALERARERLGRTAAAHEEATKAVDEAASKAKDARAAYESLTKPPQ